jgi:hypothetical protein
MAFLESPFDDLQRVDAPMTKTRVSLRLISGETSPEQMFIALEVAADHTWHRGERRPRTALVETNNGYEFVSDGSGELSIEEQASSLLCRLDPVADRIRALGCDAVQLTCVVYAAQVPAICFSSSVIEKLGRLGGSIDVDLYIVEEDREE